MSSQAKCPCGLCAANPIQFDCDDEPRGWTWDGPGYGLAVWSKPQYTPVGRSVAYCPRCGARLSFAEDGTPTVGERAAVVERALRNMAAECDSEPYEATPYEQALEFARQQLDAEAKPCET